MEHKALAMKKGEMQGPSRRARVFKAALVICCIVGSSVALLSLLAVLAVILAERGVDLGRLFEHIGYILIGAMPLLVYCIKRSISLHKKRQ